MDYAVLGYTGAYRDAVTGDYPLGNGYRAYLPMLMRFAAPDSWSPFGRGGVNPYSYCGGDPINRSDPGGHMWEQNAAHLAESTIEDEAHQASSVAAENARKATVGAGAPVDDALRRERSDSESSDDSMDFGVVNLASQTWKTTMFNDGAQYVHGSNSSSFEGVVRYGAILSADELHKTPWFWRNGKKLLSGEMYQSDPTRPLLGGRGETRVSLYSSATADLAADLYSCYGTTGEIFPVIYGVRRTVNPFSVSDHYMTEGKITLDHIAKIYVPNDRVMDAKRLLVRYGSQAMADLVTPSTVFDTFKR
jgi:RHS repeat-associated protein